MKKKLLIFAVIMTLMLSLAACGTVPPAKSETPAAEPQAEASETSVPPAAPSETEEPQPEAAETAEPAAEPGRQDGERFEAVIILEGMEETVHYEHVRNESLGFEMDYDYESLARSSEADRERFVSVWDKAEDPQNYLELTVRPEDAGTVAAAIREELSQTYDLTEEARELERAGGCLYIEASVLKGTNQMADQLQLVYIIPASDGCIVATEHLSIEAAEGFGRRFSYMLNTLSVIDG